MRAIIYPRVSSMQQTDGKSLEDQERHCRDYTEARGGSVAAIVHDVMTAKGTLDTRPGLQEVRRLFREGKADTLVVWRFDRAMRDQVDMALLYREVVRHGGHLESATEGPVENTPLGFLLLQIRMYAAAVELESITARTRGGLETRARDGKLLVGACPLYGYRFAGGDKATYLEDPDTAPVVVRIYDMARRGLSTRGIARTLTAEGIPSPKGGAWTRQTVVHIFEDSSYKGEHIVNRWKVEKTEDGRRRVVLRGFDDPARISHPVPALVDSETWESVQGLLKGRMLGPNVDQERCLLSRGFIYCGHCKQRASTKHWTAGRRRYVCGYADGSRLGNPCSVQWSVDAAAVDSAVWAAVVRSAQDTEHVAHVLEARRLALGMDHDEAEEQRRDAEAELDEVEQHQTTLRRRMATEPDDRIAAQNRVTLGELNERHAVLLVRLSSLGRKEDKAAALLASFERAHKLLWENPEPMSRGEKRAILLGLGVRVFIYRKSDPYTKEHGRRWELKFGSSEHKPAVVVAGNARERAQLSYDELVA